MTLYEILGFFILGSGSLFLLLFIITYISQKFKSSDNNSDFNQKRYSNKNFISNNPIRNNNSSQNYLSNNKPIYNQRTSYYSYSHPSGDKYFIYHNKSSE